MLRYGMFAYGTLELRITPGGKRKETHSIVERNQDLGSEMSGCGRG
jgi:hypothetical protein